jgi:predicted XRE-type DNA-binding protein
MTDTLTEDQVRAMIRAHIAGMTQKAAAASLGVSEGWVSMLMNGKARPAGKVLDAIGVQRKRMGPYTKDACYRKVVKA